MCRTFRLHILFIYSYIYSGNTHRSLDSVSSKPRKKEEEATSLHARVKWKRFGRKNLHPTIICNARWRKHVHMYTHHEHRTWKATAHSASDAGRHIILCWLHFDTEKQFDCTCTTCCHIKYLYFVVVGIWQQAGAGDGVCSSSLFFMTNRITVFIFRNR